jgi:hypothetical protein
VENTNDATPADQRPLIKCVEFGAQIDIPNVKVNFAEFVQGGTNLSLADNPFD